MSQLCQWHKWVSQRDDDGELNGQFVCEICHAKTFGYFSPVYPAESQK